jgi:hypothetical protein
MNNWRFYRSLHGRRDKDGKQMTTEKLAEQIHSERTHVTQVLNNKPGRGGKTRRKLFRVLTEEEIRALGWWDEFEKYRQKYPKKFHGEQSGTCNKFVSDGTGGEYEYAEK